MTDEPLWRAPTGTFETSPMGAFAQAASARAGRPLPDFAALQAWSISDRAGFWSLLWDRCGVIGHKGETVLAHDAMPGAVFFPDARLNFAENLLRSTGPGDALVMRAEDVVDRRLSYDALHALVSRLQQALIAAGVGPGDRVAAMLPNMPEAVAAMLAVASIGAVWSSCSPDFGVRGVLDRFGQIEPKVFLATDGYVYAGKRIDVTDKVAEIATALSTATTVVIVPHTGDLARTVDSVPRAVALATWIEPFPARPVAFTRLPFDHPLYILFSSGTTGVPKCIVHSAGGTLLQHLKEHALHVGAGPGDRLFYFTTLGWMMWNWLVSGLAVGATVMLYDGSPFHPGPSVLWDYAQAERFTLFGTSAKYIDTLRKDGYRPIDRHDLSSVRLITSTGSPLAPEGFRYVYDAIARDIPLASISGGTDIVSCFVLGVPGHPVRIGEIQGAGLGMAVEVWDEDGQPIGPGGGKGELVCTRAFPSMPIGFLNDPDGAKYRAAYFDRFPGVWCHGDFAEWTAHGGMIIHGRSDATLNPGGVRIGTAEIYAQVEAIPDVVEALAIGQSFDNDVRVVLFVRLKPGVELDAALQARIRTQIRTGASPRHVPAKIIAVADIPRTKSGKITELAVRDIVHGRAVKNQEALANPEALALFKDLPELST